MTNDAPLRTYLARASRISSEWVDTLAVNVGRTEWEGGCNACHQRPERVLVIHIHNTSTRLCRPCAGALMRKIESVSTVRISDDAT